MKIFQSVANPKIGVAIQQESANQYIIWEDPHEGGYAYLTEWRYIDHGPFPSWDAAYESIVSTYGEVIELPRL